jgi:hypothetical protein
VIGKLTATLPGIMMANPLSLMSDTSESEEDEESPEMYLNRPSAGFGTASARNEVHGIRPTQNRRWSIWVGGALTMCALLMLAAVCIRATVSGGVVGATRSYHVRHDFAAKDQLYNTLTVFNFTGPDAREGSFPRLGAGEDSSANGNLIKVLMSAPGALFALLKGAGSKASEIGKSGVPSVPWVSQEEKGAEMLDACQVSALPVTTGQSLYCWALMVPWSYERELLAFQFEQRGSLFGCDEYAVYSNEVVSIVPDVKTIMVDVDLHCEKGGEFGTALNTGIFLRIWKKVIEECNWRLHDWTVKVDPDTVFFPQKLRQVLLSRHTEQDGGVYLNNCKLGMHGPIEVFSRNAVRVFWQSHQRCIDYFYSACRGPCAWGEDMFIDQCLSKVLQVSRDFDGDMLQESNCNPSNGWKSCSNPHTVAFHPFKSVGEYSQCFSAGQAQGAR